MPTEQTLLDSETSILEGAISILAALDGQSRAIHAIYVQEESRNRNAARIQRIARLRKIPVEYLPSAQIAALSSGQTHGGVLALVGPRRFVEVAELVQRKQTPWLAMLDGIEDPYNFGQAIRALYAAGVDGLVLPPRNWLSASATVARASAGASEHMSLAAVESVDAAVREVRQHGLLVACTTHERAVSLYEADLSAPLFLIIGGEKRGIANSLLAEADLLLTIPYARTFHHSLGATAATAAIAFEIMRQRQERRIYHNR